MYKSFSAKKTPIIFLILTVVILSVVTSIFFINQKTNPPTGYEDFKQKVLQIGSTDQIGSNRNFNKFLGYIASLETQNKTKDEKNKIIQNAWAYLYLAYSETNNHQLYDLLNEYKKFANEGYGYNNFPNNIQCFDPTCAKQSIHPDVLKIIEEINSSSISAQLKDNYIQQLKSFSYLNDTDSKLKVTNFLALADSFKLDPNLKDTEISEKVYNDIRKYIQNTYPDLYKDYIEHEK